MARKSGLQTLVLCEVLVNIRTLHSETRETEYAKPEV
jgi:hypothetical protein